MKSDNTSESQLKSVSDSRPARRRRRAIIEEPKPAPQEPDDTMAIGEENDEGEYVSTGVKESPDESWKEETEWICIGSSSRLLPGHRNVVGGYSGIKYNISANGTWVWKPDAQEILELQNLAACRGGPIKRPFGVCAPNPILLRNQPEGPPPLE